MRKPLTLCSDTLSSLSQKNNSESMEDNFEEECVSPSERVIRNLMDYSRSLSVVQTKDKIFFTVMN